MAVKDKKQAERTKGAKAPRAPRTKALWGAAYGDIALGVAAFALVLNCAVMVGAAGSRVASRQRALKESEKLATLQSERRKIDGILQEKMLAAETATKQLAEKDQLLAAKDQQIGELQKQLAEKSAKHGRGKGAARKRR